MTRVSMFSSPFLLGFEPFERALDRIAKSASDGYPPYNVESLSEHHLRITVAVAGFTPEELSVAVEGSTLVVRGRQGEQNERVFLHRGIAARQFARTFVLADGMDVRSARLENGLLVINLERPEPQRLVRRIEIGV